MRELDFRRKGYDEMLAWKRELAGKAKDAAAGAVLVIALAAGTIGVIVYVRAFLLWMAWC